MKIVLGDKLRKAVTPQKSQDTNLKEEELTEVQRRIEQAMAAQSIEDMLLTGRLVSKSSSGRRWRITLSFKLNLSAPVALEFEILDEQTWEFDLVPDSEEKPT